MGWEMGGSFKRRGYIYILMADSCLAENNTIL